MTDVQLELGEVPAPLHHRGAVETEREAALLVRQNVNRYQRLVLDYLEQCAAEGATGNETSEATGIPLDICRPRLTELHLAGLLVRTARTRATGRGLGKARVYVLRRFATIEEVRVDEIEKAKYRQLHPVRDV